MVAFLGNWQSCPTGEQVAQYTHILISFAVSYTWSPGQNQQCTIGSLVPFCNNQNRQDLVDQWRAAGKKVIVSFGGAGMGGSRSGDSNYCWEYCFGKEESVVSQLKMIVETQRFDGVDIDYEYFFEDGEGYRLQNGAAVRKFIEDVTGYINTAANGLTGGANDALSHYNNLVSNMFGGDPTRVVLGFCISDCGGFNAPAHQTAKTVMTDLSTYHSCNGGAFFWVVELVD